MRKTVRIIGSLCAVGLLMLGASACQPTNSPPPADENVLTLNASELSLTIGDEYSLIADYTPIDGEETKFVSSNPEVASVDAYGRIVANRAGEAVITVSYGELSKTCTITVGFNGILPTLTFEESIADNVQVGIGESINLGAYVTFNNVSYTDATITYTYSDDTIGVVEEGLFTPVKVGTTAVTITASWRGMEGVDTLTKTINLTAINVVEMLVNGGEANLTLYNIALLGGNEYEVSKDFVVEAKENGVAIPADRISISVEGDEEILRYENGKIYGVKPGETTVVVSVTDQFGEVYEERVSVTVLTSIGDYDTQIAFSAYDGELPITDIFGADVELISAYAGDKQLAINASKDGVLGLTTTKEGPSEQQITVYSDTQAWNLNLLVYSGIIDEAKDLDMFYLGSDRNCTNAAFAEEDTFDGYYILANDIDCTGYIFGASKEAGGATPKNLQNPAGIGSTSMLNVGLTGVFDGRGYSITNFTPNGAGLFAAINGGTLKNVKISSPGSYAGGGAFLAAMIRGATLENVYVEAGSLTMYGTNGLSKFVIDSTLKNCVFKCTTTASGRTWGGTVYAIMDSTFVNCYALTNRPLSADAVESKGGKTYDGYNQKPENDTSETIWVEGIKRYEDEAALAADTTNDLTLFPGRYWEVVDGAPVWRTNKEATVEDANGNVIGEELYLEINQQLQLKVFAYGEECAAPTLTILDGDTVIEVEGTTLTTLAEGEAILKITWFIDDVEYEKTVAITVTFTVEDYAQTLMFSAYDGLFFNAQGEVVSVEDIFGAGAVLTDAVHATDTLTISNGAVLGLTTNGTEAVNTQIVLYTIGKGYKINVRAYTLIIDEASDMNLFHHGGNGKGFSSANTWTFDGSLFNEAEDKFDGYYILVKDIDMSQSLFATQVSFERSRYLQKNSLEGLGLTGTFDGNGHKLYNYAPQKDGGALFSSVDGGTVKNVSITNDNGASVVMTTYFAGILRNATIENVYVDLNYNLAEGVAMLANIVVNTTFKNCIFVARPGASEKFGLINYIQDGTTSFTDCYLISGAKVGQRWLDGAWRTLDGGNQTADYTMAGISRYATVADLEAAEATNAFTSFATSGYWMVETGKVPVWKTKA